MGKFPSPRRFIWSRYKQVVPMSFSPESRREIFRRDHYQSRVSEKIGRLEAAHIDHSRKNPCYDSPENGMVMTIGEHLIDHVARHGKNGLTRGQNYWAVQAIIDRMFLTQ